MTERPTIKPARVDPGTIPVHREAGWPEFHPEDFCHRCGDRNPDWFASAEDWAIITTEWLGHSTHAGICCPACAAELWTAATGKHVTWELSVWTPEATA